MTGALDLTKVNGLGPQCFTCRRRRVKCDSTAPTCLRCQKDDLECRGYEKQLKIVQFRPQRRPRNLQHDTVLQLGVDRPMTPNKDEMAILDAVRCFNEFVLPASSPIHRPFKRQEIPLTVPWLAMPKVIWQLLIVTVHSLRSSRNGIDPSFQQDVCHHRGQSLCELRQYLPEAIQDVHGIALVSILLLMGSDLFSSISPSWTLHFEAARKIILLRGGLQKCISSLPDIRAPLINFMMFDILSGTTCKSTALFSKHQDMKEHANHVALIDNLEWELLALSHTCPSVILQAIVSTNVQRSCGQACCSSHIPSHEVLQPLSTSQSCGILDSIATFDAGVWSTQILHQDQSFPQRLEDNTVQSIANIAAFTALGVCYKSAATLYHLLSCTPTRSPQLWSMIKSAKQALDSQAAVLFATGTCDSDGPLHQQLWKFITWPLMVSAYARVGWNISCGVVAVDVELETLHARATALKSTRLQDAVRCFRHIQKRRETLGDRGLWTWDDGFEFRCAFGV